uniref:Survival protein SurE-like phosphatase/nucleotidase domain-containing protein n=1 Tax=Zea mays TaxID=4577 RepID=A0A804RHC4_MAIZE
MPPTAATSTCVPPESDKQACGHSITIRETTASSVDFTGAKAFETLDTPVDCVSLALSGRLFACFLGRLLLW